MATIPSFRRRAPVDPGALSSGREYPRLMYHATKEAVLVSSPREEQDLGPEWSRMYVHQEYPKVKHHWSGENRTVRNADEEAVLGGGWSNSLSAFEAYKGPRRTRIEERNPCKWADEWSVPGLTANHRNKIKAQLLRADGAFERSPDADPESGALACMRQVFDGVAQVLFEAGLLTPDLLRKELPELVWDSAIAGGWWRRASETRQDIFPEQYGHYWIWREDSREGRELFRAETREWEARLLESTGPEAPAGESPGRRRGYRAEVRQWMEREGIETISQAAKRLAVSESTLKSIMSDRGECRYSQQTLNRILSIIDGVQA